MDAKQKAHKLLEKGEQMLDALDQLVYNDADVNASLEQLSTTAGGINVSAYISENYTDFTGWYVTLYYPEYDPGWLQRTFAKDAVRRGREEFTAKHAAVVKYLGVHPAQYDDTDYSACLWLMDIIKGATGLLPELIEKKFSAEIAQIRELYGATICPYTEECHEKCGVGDKLHLPGSPLQVVNCRHIKVRKVATEKGIEITECWQ